MSWRSPDIVSKQQDKKAFRTLFTTRLLYWACKRASWGPYFCFLPTLIDLLKNTNPTIHFASLTKILALLLLLGLSPNSLIRQSGPRSSGWPLVTFPCFYSYLYNVILRPQLICTLFLLPGKLLSPHLYLLSLSSQHLFILPPCPRPISY